MTQRRGHLHHRPFSPRWRRTTATAEPLGGALRSQDPAADFLARLLMVLCGLLIATALGLLVTGASPLVVVSCTAFTAAVAAVRSRQIRRASRVRPAAGRYSR